MSKFAQKFSPKRIEYVYDKNIDNLVKVKDIDIQREISSFKDLTLEKILDKYLDIDLNIPVPDFSYSDEIVELPTRDFFDLNNERDDLLFELEQNGINEKNAKDKEQFLKNKIKERINKNEKENIKKEE